MRKHVTAISLGKQSLRIARKKEWAEFQAPKYSGLEKKLSGRPGQVDFPFGQVTFSLSLPHGQGPRQAVHWLNFW